MSAGAVQHTGRAHSELSASGCHRWWNCPGSVRASRGVPGKSSPHARKGTAAHQIAEQCLHLQVRASRFVGTVQEVEGERIEITEEMADDIQVYLDDVAATGEDEPGGKPADLERRIEARFDLSALKPPAPMFGTADFIAYSRSLRKLWVKDYKNGYMHVAETSPQLKYYAIGAALFLGPKYPISEVEVTVVQPNGSADAVRRVTYNAAELAAWARELRSHAEAAMKPDAPLNPGPWCQFCPIAAVCRARADQAVRAAGVEFGALVEVDAHPPELRTVTPEQLAVFLAKADELDAYIKDARALAMSELSAGRAVGDWKLVPKRPVRSWRGADDDVAAALAARGTDPYVRKLVTPAAAEAAIADTMPGRTKKERTEAAKAALAPLVQSVSSGPTLAPGSDPRPALPAAGSEFSALPE